MLKTNKNKNTFELLLQSMSTTAWRNDISVTPSNYFAWKFHGNRSFWFLKKLASIWTGLACHSRLWINFLSLVCKLCLIFLSLSTIFFSSSTALEELFGVFGECCVGSVAWQAKKRLRRRKQHRILKRAPNDKPFIFPSSAAIFLPEHQIVNKLVIRKTCLAREKRRGLQLHLCITGDFVWR